jgi:hypothetical protein
MQLFLKNKEGQYRFSQKDTQWLTLFAGESDSIVTQLSGAQTQMQLDRKYINEGVIPPAETTDSKTGNVGLTTTAPTQQ